MEQDSGDRAGSRTQNTAILLLSSFPMEMYGRRMTLADQPPAAALLFQTLLAHGPLTRAEIGRRTGLSPGAITKVATPLLTDGGTAELARTADRPAGRPATLIAVRSERARFVGVKITGDEL